MGLFLTGEYNQPESIKGYQALKSLSLKKSGYLGEKKRLQFLGQVTWQYMSKR